MTPPTRWRWRYATQGVLLHGSRRSSRRRKLYKEKTVCFTIWTAPWRRSCRGWPSSTAAAWDTLSQLKKGEKKKLYTYLNVGESIFDLYGFATQNELNSFKLLLGVSGVGPKAALAILSANTPEGLAMAIVTEDAKSLTAAQGIGKKIAQRIILELKDKMAKETASGLDFSGGKGAAVPAVFTSKATEAAAALAVLGYSTQEVQMALKGVDVENLPLEEIIRQSLKKMVK